MSDQTLTSNVDLYRSGGIAGFRDHLVLSPDGVATLHRQDKVVVRCRVRPEPLRHIAQAAAKAASATAPSLKSSEQNKMTPRNPVPDQVTVTVAVGDSKATATEITDGDDPAWKSLYDSMGKLFQQSQALASPQKKHSTGPTICDRI